MSSRFLLAEEPVPGTVIAVKIDCEFCGNTIASCSSAATAQSLRAWHILLCPRSDQASRKLAGEYYDSLIRKMSEST